MLSLHTIHRVWIPVGFIICLLPMVWILLQIFAVGGLGLSPNPIEEIQDWLGIWGLRLIMMTLTVTPFRWLIRQHWPVRFRRMLGRFAFTYCLAHFLTYVVLDQSFDWSAIIEDITERPYMTIGFAALVLMVPLAITSSHSWRRKLGRRWQILHRLIYVAGIAGCWHFYWQVKKDVTEPLIYIAILTVLLGARVVHQLYARTPTASKERG